MPARPDTPYSADLGDRDPIQAMHQTSERIQAVVGSWPASRFEQTYAAGKWTARQILIHLAQTELALGNRARMALATPHYVAQSFDQDEWMVRESRLSGKDALEALLAIGRMNAELFGSLPAADRAVGFSHP